MICYISVSRFGSGYRKLTAVHQCLRNSITTHRRQLCRELRTYSKYEYLTMSGIRCRPILCQPRVYLWRTDLSAIKRNAIYHTGCSHFSSGSKNHNDSECSDSKEEKKLSLYQKFKLMYKKYWYVLIPVHCATSIVWFGGFYYLAASGIDIAGIMESWGAPVKWVDYLRNSASGHVFVAYFLYKIASPLRYAVSIGGTTISINYLRKWGCIKPVPNKEEIKRIYEEQKGAFKDFTSSYRDKIQFKKDELQSKKKEMTQQYKEVRDGLQRSVLESGKEFKEGVQVATSEWKHIDTSKRQQEKKK
ncbi:UNVERIFIED_CONTAM: hypothetical protein PYX00_006834 [Menopon gallinae]|uniref:DUF1279 domain-containing protein n=1 Tax=Menopon gallinae TaxID=328185 RepID=A0AAW2HX65_9NEOP